MFSPLENWLYLKTCSFLFFYCKDNTKTDNYVFKHRYKTGYLTYYVYFIWIVSIH